MSSSSASLVNDSEKQIIDMMFHQSAKDLINCSTEIQKQGFEILRKHFWLAKSIKLAKSNLICFKMIFYPDKNKKIASLVHLPNNDTKLKECTECKFNPEVNSHAVIINLMNQLTDIQLEYNDFVAKHQK